MGRECGSARLNHSPRREDVRHLAANCCHARAPGLVGQRGSRVYRFTDYPTSPAGTYLESDLWTGQQRAYLSHDAALLLHDLRDINPGQIHSTVPRGSRLRRAGGKLYEVHHQDLQDVQLGWRERSPIVTA